MTLTSNFMIVLADSGQRTLISKNILLPQQKFSGCMDSKCTRTLAITRYVRGRRVCLQIRCAYMYAFAVILLYTVMNVELWNELVLLNCLIIIPTLIYRRTHILHLPVTRWNGWIHVCLCLFLSVYISPTYTYTTIWIYINVPVDIYMYLCLRALVYTYTCVICSRVCLFVVPT